VILRAAAAAVAAAVVLTAPAAQAAWNTPPTAVTGAARLDDHSVRLTVRTPGDLDASQVDARLGDAVALVEGVHRAGPSRPLRLVFALDTSGSMAGMPITAAIAAGQRLLDTVGTGDRVGLVVFDDSARVVAPLSGNVGAVRNALSSVATARGTSLYDGVALAAKLTGSGRHAQRVVVVLSDGADTSSRGSLAGVERRLGRSGVEVDAIGLTSSGSYTAGPLRDIAAATGGDYVSTNSVAGLEPILLTLSQRRLATSYHIDVALPHSAARDLHVSVKGAPPQTVALPDGVGGLRYPFWRRYGNWLAVALGAFAVLVSSLLGLDWAARRPRSLASRLSPYSAELRSEVKEQHTFALDVYEWLDQHLGRTAAWRRLHRLSERAGSTAHTGRHVLIIGVSGLLPAVPVLLTRFAIVAPLVMPIGCAVPIGILRLRAARRQRQFDAQLPELLTVWASALRAGRSFVQALDSIVDEAADPARVEFRRAQQQVRLGVPVEQALDEMSQRLGSESFELVVLATDVQRRIGGNVAQIFDQVAETVRKRQQFAARVRALVAMGVLSARVLIAMPFVIAGVLTLINHDYMRPLFTTSTGHWLIAVALTMMAIGFLALRRMVRPRAIA
jgi:tight adherence protein B